MKPYYQDSHCTIYHGDCREVLPLITENLIGLVLTVELNNHPVNPEFSFGEILEVPSSFVLDVYKEDLTTKIGE